jgi:hypothetical protein
MQGGVPHLELFDLEPVMVRGELGKDRVGIANRLLGDRRRTTACLSHSDMNRARCCFFRKRVCKMVDVSS